MPIRYRQLQQPTLIDTTPLETGDSQAATALANAFKQFEGVALEPAAGLRAQQGKREGAAAGSSDDPQFREGLRSLTAYGAAYNDSAMRSYAIKAEADAEDQAARLEVEAQNDPEKFNATFGAVRDETLKHAPPQARQVLGDIYTRRLGAGTARLTGARAEEINKQARADTSEGVQRAIDRIATLRASDDPSDAAQAEIEQAKLTLLIDGAHNSGTMSETEWQALHVKSQRAIVSQTVSARFQKELDSPYGNPVQFIEKLKKANQTSDVLSPEEEDKLVSGLMSDLREHNTLYSAENARSAAEEKARYEAGNREATSDLLSGNLTVRKLRDMVDQHQLDPDRATSLANELENGGVAADDPKVAFDTRTNLLDYSEDDISTMPGLTWKTRGELILKRREDALGWKGTQAASEAFDRIDRALGILPGVDSRMLSEEDRAARNNARTELYNVIDVLPPNERQDAVLNASSDVVGRFIRKSKSAEAQTLRIAKQRFMQSQNKDPNDMGDKQRKAYEERLKRYDTDIAAFEAEAARK